MHDLAHCSQKGRQSLDSLWLDLYLSFMHVCHLCRAWRLQGLLECQAQSHRDPPIWVMVSV